MERTADSIPYFCSGDNITAYIIVCFIAAADRLLMTASKERYGM